MGFCSNTRWGLSLLAFSIVMMSACQTTPDVRGSEDTGPGIASGCMHGLLEHGRCRCFDGWSHDEQFKCTVAVVVRGGRGDWQNERCVCHDGWRHDLGGRCTVPVLKETTDS